jgi:hypothetical protein
LQIIIYLILALALPPMLEFPFILRILRECRRWIHGHSCLLTFFGHVLDLEVGI